MTCTKCDIVYYLVLEELSNAEIYRKLGYSKSRYFELKAEIKKDPVFHEI